MVGKISCKQDNLVFDACFLVLCQKYLNNTSYIFITAVLQKKPFGLSTWSAAPQWFYSAKNNNSWKRSASSGLFPYSTIKGRQKARVSEAENVQLYPKNTRQNT